MALVVALALGVLASSAWAATTVKGSKSNSDNRVRSSLLSSSVGLSGGGQTSTVYRTPVAGDFTLTHVCVSPAAPGGILVSADGIGALIHLGELQSCATFAPGLILPPNANLTCTSAASAPAGNYFCTVSGMQAPAPAGNPWGAP
ncbi:MAG: hypothetical protein SF182_14970 [Deltaproteobacteria bacterium]|nr:hypothetical protein [Deltaproteobacteria bacterium]